MRSIRLGWWRMVAGACGILMLLTGCDATTRAAVESGVIDASSSLLASFMQALIALAGEQSA